ncbi:hypothetical protein BDV32DRAFT_144181 [Aspergillus pseudonomiae]|uniref:Uncharacterized protein n=1 Tax=Aspergillus pseudonomiae TaxID=1506151 RepID=A0A5N7DGZ7_9EURO|nr:uncharacterized protein BDV37DRAFT_281541 [Aspergillus pseudonomiae]KAB8265660.1 hypothetical protein BDV32DRAFT_144181 [Aspergillus pseudonomiae]KAE8405706.1 hypothetical protein BDV37DRAFT_281541 [Aspergillus pseudonomiae]
MASGQSPTSEECEFLSQQDGRFLIECLRNIDESRAVNLTNVGATMGYTNTSSVANRFRALRKRYDFPNLDATTKPSNASATSTASVSTTPSGKGKRKGPGVGRKKKATKSGEFEDPFITDDSEAETIIAAEVPKVKATPKKGARKGAKVTSTPTPATDLGAPKGGKHSKATSESTVKTENVKDESIDVNLLNAVNDAMEMYEDTESFEKA